MFQDRTRGQGIQDTSVFKTEDASTATHVFQNDDQLFVDLVAGNKYIFRAVLFCDYGTFGFGGGIKFSFSGFADYFIAKAMVETAADVYPRALLEAVDGVVLVPFVEPPACVLIDGYIEPSQDGAFQLQFAQLFSDPIESILKQGSSLTIWRVA